MPTTLVLSFPWGRYHATPWGRHVNEGEVELPPSPWRLLRTLYAVWRTRAPELDDQVVRALLARLAEPPVFHVPRHGISHTRHYYPDATHRRGKPSTDRTLDAFAVFERGADLAAVWPFELPGDELTALQRLAASIPYFGRADSLCSGSVPAEWAPSAHDTWVPADVAESVPIDADVTAVLAATLPLDVDTLLARPAEVRRGGLLFPAGSRLTGYWRQRTAPRPRRARHTRTTPPTAVRFSVLQAGLPPATEALAYTDLLRQAALANLGGLREERERSQLGGKDADGRPLQGHGHAHFLPLLHERRLSGLVVWTPHGLPDDELKALTGVTRLYSPVRQSWRLAVRVAGIGHIADTAPELVTAATVWHSITPITPPRYPGRRDAWPDFLEGQVRRELGHRGIPAPRAVELVDGDWREVLRSRPSRWGGRRGTPNRPSAYLRVTFDEPVAGPIALGHLSHFGLGLFAPE